MSHTCHAQACKKAVSPKMLMCARHWRMVPKRVQRWVWATYQKGQETTKTPESRYLVAHFAAVIAVAVRENRPAAAIEWDWRCLHSYADDATTDYAEIAKVIGYTGPLEPALDKAGLRADMARYRGESQ